MDEQIIQKIFVSLKTKNYTIDPKILGKGAFANIYAANKNGQNYVIRIVKLDPNNVTNEVQTRRKISETLSQTKCSAEHKCTVLCIDNNIACSEFTLLMFGNYLVEILKKYDNDLKKYMTRDILDEKNNIIGIEDTHRFNELVMKDSKYLLNFNSIVKSLWKALKTMHDKNLAHGDIKPENILIKVNQDEIVDVAISDFDTLCIGTKNLKTGKIECNQNETSVLFATFELQKENRNKLTYDIEIKKRSDIYAMSLVTLMLWYGFIGFLDNFVSFLNNFLKYNDAEKVFANSFANSFQDLSKPENSKREELFTKFKKWHNEQFQLIRNKYPNQPGLLTTSNYLYSAIETLRKSMNMENVSINIQIQSGGSVDYKSKYLKYKKKYLAIK